MRWPFRTDFARSVAILMTGTVAGQLVTIVASPIIARLYGPADYGVLAVLGSVLSILLVVVSLRYEVASPVARGAVEAAQLLALSLTLVLVISLMTAVAITAAGGIISAALGMPSVRPYLWYLPVALLAAGVYNALRYSAVRAGDFRRIARSRVWQGAGGTSVQIALGLSTKGPLG
ncbi:MAG TPA: oligosaccharide flippase family protein, partial [Gemmatimonadaceae bacterium]|nr:oligosaccharide flippase family protein [Gemmatimonadaceae bacterium]